MMIKSTMLAAVMMLGIAGLGGCESSSTAGGDADAMAVMCPKCRTTWVSRPHRVGTKVTIFRSEKAMTCPECEAMAADYFKTGQLKKECKACGVAMEPCTVH